MFCFLFFAIILTTQALLNKKEVEAHLNDVMGDIWRDIYADHTSRQSLKRNNECRESDQEFCEDEALLRKRSFNNRDVATRLIVAIQNNTVSSIPSIILLQDTNHTKGIVYGKGSITSASAQAFDEKAKDYFARTFATTGFGPCFNFTGQPWIQFPGFPAGFGGWVTSCGLAIQYLIGVDLTNSSNPVYDYIVKRDSEHPNRDDKWIMYITGVLAQSSVNVSTPAGLVWQGNVLGYANYMLANPRASSWTSHNTREFLRVATPFTSKQISLNQWTGTSPTVTENLSPLRLIDRCCDPGIGVISTTFGNVTYETGRPLNKYNTFVAQW